MLLRLLVPLAGPGGPLRARVARVVLLIDAVFMLVYSALAYVFKWSSIGIVIGMVIVLTAALSHRWLLRSDASHDCPALTQPPGGVRAPAEPVETTPLPTQLQLILGIVASSIGLVASGILFVLHLLRDDLHRPERQIFSGSAFVIGLGCFLGLAASVHASRKSATTDTPTGALQRAGSDAD